MAKIGRNKIVSASKKTKIGMNFFFRNMFLDIQRPLYINLIKLEQYFFCILHTFEKHTFSLSHPNIEKFAFLIFFGGVNMIRGFYQYINQHSKCNKWSKIIANR